MATYQSRRKGQKPKAVAKAVVPKAKAIIVVERNGAMMRIDDVPSEDAATVLAEMLAAFRALSKRYPELIPDLGTVGAGDPVWVPDEYEDEESQRRIGFTAC